MLGWVCADRGAAVSHHVLLPSRDGRRSLCAVSLWAGYHALHCWCAANGQAVAVWPSVEASKVSQGLRLVVACTESVDEAMSC